MKQVAAQEKLRLKLQKICLELPESSEKLSWGNPTFFAGKKSFASLDHYEGHACLVTKAKDSARKASLMKDARFFDPPYVGSKGWIALKLDVKPVDWQLVETLIGESYEQVALKRMLTALADGGSER